MRERLEQIESSTGVTPKALKHKPFPFVFLRVWNTFTKLSNSRGASMSGPMPITYQDIRAFMEVTGTRLNRVEVSLIKTIDNVYMEVVCNG